MPELLDGPTQTAGGRYKSRLRGYFRKLLALRFTKHRVEFRFKIVVVITPL